MNILKAIVRLQRDVEKLKMRAFQPTKIYARVFKDYLSWGDCSARTNFETIYSYDLEILNDWFEIYCKKYNCTKAEALDRIIEEGEH